ncbi:SapC family protein [Paraglaciecola marina]|uniref:SapC family protein n=1 Tax=Paraglaciecola marina TaxID=2500157 RepID=UPI00105E0E8E|nr:SapC family protein [Paraglaciecola marina]
MTNTVLLNSIDHKDVRVVTSFGEQYGDNVWYTATFPLEFRSIQAHYPIFFQKDPNTGGFYPVAMTGFQESENLFLEGDKWNAGYVPLMIKRQPFFIGKQDKLEEGKTTEHRVIHIDLDSPRISDSNGQELFVEFGASSPFLTEMADMLETIHHGMETNQAFVQSLLKYDLIESFTLDIELNDGSQHNMIGFYTIQEDNLRTLDKDALAELHQAGFLESAYMMLASQSNLRNLIDLKNKRNGL